MATQTRRYEISDGERERIEGLIPKREAGTRGRPPKENRKMLNGILWVTRSGAAWRDLPERYGPWETVYKRFAKWQEDEVVLRIFIELSVEADLQDMSMDSSVVKVHQSGTGAKKGI